MKVIIDTNSLLSLVRYYLPFDKNKILYNFIKEKIQTGEIILIDKVYMQCSYISKGIIISELDFLNDKDYKKSAKIPYNTELTIPPNTKKFFHLLNSVFVNSVIMKAKKITEVEFETLKNSHLNDADMKLVLLSLNLIAQGENVFLVTEETSESNDNKLFVKIPAMCRELSINCINLPALIKLYQDDFDLHFK
ncbi:DUF4411 family protein [Flavobacterium cheniae]|uniref:Uncharacterized protein DUF4411 n=1 Tax=Flavobacterium cheniae TaxID=295428 RepID=A0A562KCK0_9FLAO|nr:DUF4411 family protein [Flavobacterium cheniae]TDR18565.1 uncharacterized protein DUF4411 [Flavobacterium cheniae]TWH92953.1 uncharacterized protein DUF4411 [Flavobacterium cheniae]